MFRALLFAVLSVALATPADPAAAEPTMRLLPEQDQPAWSAVGRVNIAGYNRRRMCSGVLVAPARVLTAAHCVLKGRRIAPAEEVVFVAGWRAGASAGDATGARITIHPDFLSRIAAGELDIGSDLAVIELSAPIEGVSPLPLGALPDPAPIGTALTILGYRADRPHIATLHTGCTLLHDAPNVLLTACDVAQGTSGAPVLAPALSPGLAPGGGAPTVVGIVSARSLRGTLVARAAAWDAARP
ncbi:MAG: trypsin-like peptidase domain-containing protein [Pseudomonadota bacterium]